MQFLSRLKNRLIARIITRYPSLAKKFIDAYRPWETGGDVPWSPVAKPLAECRVALVTTAGVHHGGQEPFDMNDPDGDPSWREIDLETIAEDYTITHDYYDHSDAAKDINIVLPVERLQEFRREGIIGDLAATAYAFMGHIDGAHIPALIENRAPEIAARLKADHVDVALLTPA